MIEGELIRLRAREPEDVPVMYELFNDADVRRYLALHYPQSRRAEEEFVAATGVISYDRCGFAVVDREDGRLLGGVDLRTKAPEVRVAELGIVLFDKTVWGRGYGTDTMRTACRFGFEEMDLARIELWVHEGNDNARHVYDKVGFVHEGTARQAWYARGERVDMHLYGLLRGELR